MTQTRRRRRTQAPTPKKARRPQAQPITKRAKKPKPTAPAQRGQRQSQAIEGPTLKSQAQLEIRFARGARPLTAIEQAARLATARMERRIGRLLSRRVRLKFR